MWMLSIEWPMVLVEVRSVWAGIQKVMILDTAADHPREHESCPFMCLGCAHILCKLRTSPLTRQVPYRASEGRSGPSATTACSCFWKYLNSAQICWGMRQHTTLNNQIVISLLFYFQSADHRVLCSRKRRVPLVSDTISCNHVDCQMIRNFI